MTDLWWRDERTQLQYGNLGGAYFSPDGVYRYRLWRHTGYPLARQQPRGVLFICLNPSTADACADDPTVRRCAGYTRAWGYTRLAVANLYAYRATDPRALRQVADPVGPECDHYLRYDALRADLVVAAWGAGAPAARVAQVLAVLTGVQLHALGTTKAGAPRHPLYMPKVAQPQAWP